MAKMIYVGRATPAAILTVFSILMMFLVAACSGDSAVADAEITADQGVLPIPDAAAPVPDTVPSVYEVHLGIKPRMQWLNSNGYCGCCTIQQIALYYGAWVSQDACRKTIGDKEVLVSVNDDQVLEALSFTYEAWPEGSPQPQCKGYLGWIKQHLYNGSPVAITVNIEGKNKAGYDHIIPAIGFRSTEDADQYNDSDLLAYNDCLTEQEYVRRFDTLCDHYTMTGPCAGYHYCLSEQHDDGTAVTGIKDPDGVTLPVRISLTRWDEPNVTLGEAPTMLEAAITVSSLSPGKKYVLLRYDDHTKVPDRGFSPTQADSAVPFTATKATETFSDSFLSSGVAIYRCVPAP